jgi:presequence protease
MKKQSEKYKVGANLSGWTIKRVKKIEGNDIVFVELEHLKTGARYIHLDSKDDNNVFCVCFKTVPYDSTGIAHILEHTVLTGSKKYPFKDPFFLMMKRSLKTFMNAFTSSDWTAYPFATQNKKDFYNLMSIYLDAVFHPNLARENFNQEGWRYEFENEDLAYKGVVYNEMKGAMSQAERVVVEEEKKALFKESPYKWNSGGDPKEIVNLKHEDLVSFHGKYYHPSNAYFFSYGSLKLSGHLEFIEKNIMGDYAKEMIDSEINPEPRRSKRESGTASFPADRDGNEKKHQALIAWLMPDITDAHEVLALDILDDILLGNPASPLRKALIESRLGSDLVDESGYNTEFRDTMFTVGLKDISQADAHKVKELIFDALSSLVKTGIDKELASSALHKLEIDRKEISNHPYPYGLRLWLDLVGPWIHGGDVLDDMNIDQALQRIKKAAEEGQFFETLIKKYFLQNEHQVFLTLDPDYDQLTQEMEKMKNELKEKQKNLSGDQENEIKEDAQKLLDLQDREEDLKLLPTLEIKDIKKTIKQEKSDVFNNLRLYEKPTNGLSYFNIVFDLKGIDEKYLPLIPTFCHILNRIGTKKHGYVELIRLIEKQTGGVDFFPVVNHDLHEENKTALAIVAGFKCLDEDAGDCLDIVKEIISDYDFKELEQIEISLKDSQSGMESSVIEYGHSLAFSLASSSLDRADAINESWNGITQLSWLKKMNRDMDNAKLEKIRTDLMHVAGFLFQKGKTESAIIGEKKTIRKSAVKLKSIIDSLPERKVYFNWEDGMKARNIFKGVDYSSSVSFVAASKSVPDIRSAEAPALLVLSKLLGLDYLHKEIREKNGAYGCYARYDFVKGVLGFFSYRDPHIVSTLKTYLGAGDYIAKAVLDKKAITEAVLQICSEIDKPLAPAESAEHDFMQKYTGLSFEMLQDFREKIIAVSVAEVRTVAQKYLSADIKDYSIAVISSQEKLKKANVDLEEMQLEIVKI